MCRKKNVFAREQLRDQWARFTKALAFVLITWFVATWTLSTCLQHGFDTSTCCNTQPWLSVPWSSAAPWIDNTVIHSGLHWGLILLTSFTKGGVYIFNIFKSYWIILVVEEKRKSENRMFVERLKLKIMLHFFQLGWKQRKYSCINAVCNVGRQKLLQTNHLLLIT